METYENIVIISPGCVLWVQTVYSLREMEALCVRASVCV